ncbi:MAG: hypothetical protein MJZ60_06245 [Bacteroidaceae bacterium]|nr:hypothetical protein [Bacteroidaceae bacterium]
MSKLSHNLKIAWRNLLKYKLQFVFPYKVIKGYPDNQNIVQKGYQDKRFLFKKGYPDNQLAQQKVFL